MIIVEHTYGRAIWQRQPADPDYCPKPLLPLKHVNDFSDHELATTIAWMYNSVDAGSVAYKDLADPKAGLRSMRSGDFKLLLTRATQRGYNRAFVIRWINGVFTADIRQVSHHNIRFSALRAPTLMGLYYRMSIATYVMANKFAIMPVMAGPHQKTVAITEDNVIVNNTMQRTRDEIFCTDWAKTTSAGGGVW